MDADSPRPGVIQRILYDTHADLIEEEEEKEKVEEEENYPSKYVKLVQDMLHVILTEEPELFNEEERNLLLSYKRLSYESKYILVRLLLRTPGKWIPTSSIRNYHSEIGDNLNAACEELCKDLGLTAPLNRPDMEAMQVGQTKYEDEKEKKNPTSKLLPGIPMEEYPDVIDLTFDSDEEEKPKSKSGLRRSPWPHSSQLPTPPASSQITPFESNRIMSPTPMTHTARPSIFTSFCRPASTMTLNEKLETLSSETLRDLMRDNKLSIKPGSKKVDCVTALLAAANSQTMLAMGSKKSFTDKDKTSFKKLKGKDAPDSSFKDMKQQSLSCMFSSTKPTKPSATPLKTKRPEVLPIQAVASTAKPGSKKLADRLNERASELLGTCVKLDPEVYKLFRRAHIIYFRGTELPEKILLPSLLVAFKKRTYPIVGGQLQESNAMHTPAQEENDNDDPPPDLDSDLKDESEDEEYVIFGARPERSRMIIWTSREKYLEFEEALETQKNIDDLMSKEIDPPFRNEYVAAANSEGELLSGSGSNKVTKDSIVKDEDPSTARSMSVEGETSDPPRIRIAKAIVAIAESYRVRERWRQLLAARLKNSDDRRAGLERYEAGHVLTRIMYKCAEVYSTLKEYDEELVILNDLIGQDIWRRGRKGRFYERRALVLASHKTRMLDDKKEKEKVLKQALLGIKAGLDDIWTGFVYRSALVHRMKGLEKRLKIPQEQRMDTSKFGDGVLLQAEETKVIGTRIRETLDVRGKVVREPACFSAWGDRGKGKERADEPPKPITPSWTGKSIWVGRDGERVNVETLALQSYEDKGYKGFHSETSILTTLFSLLLYDVLFLAVPGAFETKYQTAPLDLLVDPGAFYAARKKLIDQRLAELKGSSGTDRALQLVRIVDSRERDKKTMIVGVKWDLCNSEELEEIVTCIGGPALALICQLFCEDYVARCGGVPDLIVWKIDEKECMFVEVKGPGDRLSENQKVWNDALKRCGVQVHLCKVFEEGQEFELKGLKRKRGVIEDTTPSQIIEHNELEVKQEYREIVGPGKRRKKGVIVFDTTPMHLRKDVKVEEVDDMKGHKERKPKSGLSNPKRARKKVRKSAKDDDDDDDDARMADVVNCSQGSADWVPTASLEAATSVGNASEIVTRSKQQLRAVARTASLATTATDSQVDQLEEEAYNPPDPDDASQTIPPSRFGPPKRNTADDSATFITIVESVTATRPNTPDRPAKLLQVTTPPAYWHKENRSMDSPSSARKRTERKVNGK